MIFSKASDLWETPGELYAALDEEFRFAIDGAADATNTKCPVWFGPGGYHEDALAVEFTPTDPKGAIWLNPPYSQCRGFIEAAAHWASTGRTVVCLVPARTDTRWFHDYVYDRNHDAYRRHVTVRFLKGRLKFEQGGIPMGPAPFPSMIVIMEAHHG